MPKRVDLPRALTTRAFTTREAEVAGVGRGRLRGEDLTAPHRGVRVPDGFPGTLAGRCASLAPLLAPGGHRFSHITAAQLWDCPLPRAWADEPLHITGPRGARIAGVVGHTSTAGLGDERRHGFPVVPPELMFVQAAALLELDDLVVVADHLVLDPRLLDPRNIRPHVREHDLRTAVEAHPGRGRRRAREAVELMRQGAESRPETLLRLLLVRAGFPEPEVNPRVVDETGRWLGWADLVFRQWKVAVEYDGDQHRTDVRQYEEDIARTERFARAGWHQIKVRNSGLHSARERTVARVDEALRARGWRP